ncbi:DNA mismatch repair protein MutS [Nitrospira sp. Nam74]
MTESDLSPLMRQYRDVKHTYHDAIVFFRVGDFYEMFYEDAEIASRLLNIALTSRDKSSAKPVPLCGVPHHAAMNYIAKLLKAGRTVALCDQVEDPKSAKGLVRREVVRLYTPGTLTDSELLPLSESLFLVAIASPIHPIQQMFAPQFGLAALDASTGQFWVMELSGEAASVDLQDELYRIEPRELLYSSNLASSVQSCLQAIRGARLCPQDPATFDFTDAQRLLHEHFGVASLDGFGCRGLSLAIQAAGAVMRYVRTTQPTANLSHIARLQVRHSHHAMHLDTATIRNLELLKSLSEDRQDATLLAVLEKTVTAMGSRLLREWIVRPLLHPAAIQARHEAVDQLMKELPARAHTRTALRSVQDLMRLSSRITMGAATPREVLALKQSLVVLPQLRASLSSFNAPLLQQLLQGWDDLTDVRALIERSILPDAPTTIREGGIIQDGYHGSLDELRQTCREGKHWIARLELQERELTGIESLKIRFNQVFGYYIEVTKANAARVPDRYFRKQTLANAERFTTAELKELEERVTGSDLKLIAMEQDLFEQIRAQLAKESHRLQAMGSILAVLDVLAGFAESAALHRYVRPVLHEEGTIRILEGRHPVVEQLSLSGGFIPNDTFLDLQNDRLVVLTGPNMAGKSTYLRQTALIVLLAQIGSFVPAHRAEIGVVDRIFTRVGASDNLAGGLSTFMVEMTETAQILNCATSRSLIILDEIGRGTSTYDGLSIAWAVAEYILDPSHLGARTLFATHYHEMTELAEHRAGAKNYTVLVKEQDERVLFLRKIVPGGADRSYGIHVAQLAGLPSAIIIRAREVLDQLESAHTPSSNSLQMRTDANVDRRLPDPTLPTPHPMIEEVRQMDLFSMTPLEALNRLADLQRRIENSAQ